jgi:hypothetical protein
MGEKKNTILISVVKTVHLKDKGVDGRMGLKWTLGTLVGGVWSGFTWLRIGTVGGLL